MNNMLKMEKDVEALKREEQAHRRELEALRAGILRLST